MVTKHFLLPVFSLLDAQTLMLVSLLVSNVSEHLSSFQYIFHSGGYYIDKERSITARQQFWYFFTGGVPLFQNIELILLSVDFCTLVD
jgi:hypothetical protein